MVWTTPPPNHRTKPPVNYFHLLKSTDYFPLLVLKGIYDCLKNIAFLSGESANGLLEGAEKRVVVFFLSFFLPLLLFAPRQVRPPHHPLGEGQRLRGREELFAQTEPGWCLGGSKWGDLKTGVSLDFFVFQL